MPAVSKTAIRILVEKQGLSVQTLARKLGVKTSYINSFLNGKRDVVNENIIRKLAKLLKVSEADIRTNLSKKEIDILFSNDNITF